MRSYVRLTASVVLITTSIDGQTLGAMRCPCQYKPAGFKYATSASPIPPAHVACMKIIEQLLQSGNINSENPKLKRILRDGQSKGAAFDYGVPPTDDAQTAIAAATAEVPELEAEQQKSKADLNRAIAELAKDRATLRTLKSYGLGKDIDRNVRNNYEALVKMSEINLANYEVVATLDGVLIDMNRATIKFSSCVVNNKLPPTTDRSAIKSLVDIDKYLKKGNSSKTERDVSNGTSPTDHSNKPSVTWGRAGITDNSNKPNITWDEALRSTAAASRQPFRQRLQPSRTTPTNSSEAEVTGLMAERICPGAKINAAKLMELRRANVRNEEALCKRTRAKTGVDQVRGREVGAEQWCGWSKNQFGSEGLDYAG